MQRPAAHLRFWTKTALHLLVPGGWGYPRKLRRYSDSAYELERDLHPVRRKLRTASRWSSAEAAEGIKRRGYDSYDEYIVHQRQKLDEILKTSGGFPNAVVARWRIRFYSRFRHLLGLLPTDALIVCAGARQGTEVEVLHDLGFRCAYGIDLNPGPENPYVRAGDFHELENADASVDLVYSNSLDHAFDLKRFFAEHARVLKPGGYVLYDVSRSPAAHAVFEAIVWESEDDVLEAMACHFGPVIRLERRRGWTWVLRRAPVAT
jgi:SAM-dependent methyltransferase